MVNFLVFLDYCYGNIFLFYKNIFKENLYEKFIKREM